MTERLTSAVPGNALAATLLDLGFRAAGPGPSVEESRLVRRGLVRTSWSAPSMGTRVTVTVVHPSRDLSEDALGAAFAELDRVVPLLDRHDDGSPLSALNRRGALNGPPPELSAVLRGAAEVHQMSAGAFDVTVKPLVDLLRTRGPRGPVPDPDLRAARDLVGMRGLHVGRRRIRFRRSGMGLTLDGIAKGHVVDRMADVLVRAGLDRWLVDAGGDIRASGLNEDGRAWRIGVQDPFKRGGFPEILELRRGAVATSGGYENSFAPDGGLHHVVDTATGRSPTRTVSASVVAPTAMMADALATTALILEPGRAAALTERLPGCACLLLGADGRRRRSSRWSTTSESHP